MDLIRSIKDKSVRFDALSMDDRLACVGFLSAESLSVYEIAQHLSCSERTVQRCRNRLREASSLSRDPKLTGVLAGRLMAEAQHVAERIRRVGRDPSCPHAVRVDGEYKCYQVLDLFVQRMMAMGMAGPSPLKEEPEVPLGQLTEQVNAIVRAVSGKAWAVAAIEPLKQLQGSATPASPPSGTTA
jgi:hypothetical protein